MQSSVLLQAYTELAELMATMLATAKQDNWDHVSELEVVYLDKIAQIKSIEKTSILMPETKSQKAAIIQGILADDHQLKLLIHPWMHKLTQLMQPGQATQAAHMQARLNSAYQM